MGCATIQVGNVTAHVCGPAFGRKHCRSCGRPADALCDWPKVRKANLAWNEVKVGAEVFPFHRSDQVHRLIYLDAKPAFGCIYYATEFQGRTFQYEAAQPWRGLWVPKYGTCDSPCCARCRRHVGPDRDYCKKHWDAWLGVA